MLILEQVMFKCILQLYGINQPRNEWGYLICSRVTTVHLYEINDKTEMFFYLFFNCLFLVALKYILFYNIFVVCIPLTIPDIFWYRDYLISLNKP